MNDPSSLGKIIQTTNSRLFSIPTNNDHVVISNNPLSISNFQSPLNKAKSLVKTKPNTDNRISVFLNRANSIKKNNGNNYHSDNQFRSSYTENVDKSKERFDHYGNKIEKGKKKHKLVFRDKLTIINDLESVSIILPDDICKKESNEENIKVNENILNKDNKSNNKKSIKEDKIKKALSSESQDNCSCLCIIY